MAYGCDIHLSHPSKKDLHVNCFNEFDIHLNPRIHGYNLVVTLFPYHIDWEAANRMILGPAPLLIYGSKPVSLIPLELELDTHLQGLTGYSPIDVFAPIELCVALGSVTKVCCFTGDTLISVGAELQSLCNNLTITASSAIEMGSRALDAEICFSLGEVRDQIVLGSYFAGEHVQKLITASNVLSTIACIIESTTQFIVPSSNAMEFDVTADASVGRYRLLSEMDAEALLVYDDMTLAETDFATM